MFDKDGVIYLTRVFLYQTDICAGCTITYTDLCFWKEILDLGIFFILKYQYIFIM